MRSYQLVTKTEIKNARESIYDRDDYLCQICELSFEKDKSAVKNIDHIIPRSAFAWSHPFNLQLLCENCNAEKGGAIPNQFWDLLEENTRKTARWFIDQPPTEDTENERINIRVQEALKLNLDFNIEKSYEVFSLYYDDQYINEQTGVLLDVPNKSEQFKRICWKIFHGVIDDILEKTKEKLIELPSTQLKRREVIITQQWLKPLAFKLKTIGETEEAKKMQRLALDLGEAVGLNTYRY